MSSPVRGPRIESPNFVAHAIPAAIERPLPHFARFSLGPRRRPGALQLDPTSGAIGRFSRCDPTCCWRGCAVLRNGPTGMLVLVPNLAARGCTAIERSRTVDRLVRPRQRHTGSL